MVGMVEISLVCTFGVSARNRRAWVYGCVPVVPCGEESNVDIGEADGSPPMDGALLAVLSSIDFFGYQVWGWRERGLKSVPDRALFASAASQRGSRSGIDAERMILLRITTVLFGTGIPRE